MARKCTRQQRQLKAIWDVSWKPVQSDPVHHMLLLLAAGLLCPGISLNICLIVTFELLCWRSDTYNQLRNITSLLQEHEKCYVCGMLVCGSLLHLVSQTDQLCIILSQMHVALISTGSDGSGSSGRIWQSSPLPLNNKHVQVCSHYCLWWIVSGNLAN